MFQLSKSHVLLTFIALILLRVTVGWHFFNEGADKIKAGDFTAEYFLKSAKGPIAPWLQQLLEDPDGQLQFCLSDDGRTLDPEITFAIWDDFLDRVHGHYRFGDSDLETKLVERRAMMADKIHAARANRDASVDVKELENLRRQDEQKILKLRQQAEAGEEILDAHVEELSDWLDSYRSEIIAWYGTRDRVHGFDRDGSARNEVATYVASLRDQVGTIRMDRQKQMNQWSSEVNAIWDSYEREILTLPIEEQTAGKSTLSLHRPFDQTNTKLKWINWFIPWFDIVVGGLLIVGLFTRLASVAAGGFLATIIATQPPWLPGMEPTYLYSIELVALLVIFATCAGRIGGLDFFLVSRRQRQSDPNIELAADN